MKTLRLGWSSRAALPILLAALAVPLTGTAADDPAGNPAQGGEQGMGKMHRMKDKHCPMMMMRHGRMPQMLHMPRLPPGNDKLQLQMEAEILQKIGEIQGKYANQLP